MAYARHQFAMSKRHGEKATVRDHLTHALKHARTPKARAALEAQLTGPPMPRGFGPLYETFIDLHRWRGGGGMGMSPLTLHDIEVWERRFLPDGVRFTPVELDLIKRLDTVALTEH